MRYLGGTLFLMRTKYCPCPCSHPRQKRQLFKFSTTLSGPRTRSSSQAWLQKPLASDDETETMEHLLYGCENYSTKIWALAGRVLMLAILRHSGDFIPRIELTPLEIIFNKPHPSILLHVPDGTTRKVLILFLQEVKRDIIFRRAQLTEPRRREELQARIQAYLLSVITKIQALLEYQGVLNYTDALALLWRMSHSMLND